MKKLLTRSGIALVTVAVVVAGAAAFSAYEAHIVNVTATIDNATNISTSELLFGQVFPQEILHQPVTLALSQSFTQSGALGVDYVIKQKPKCIATSPTGAPSQYAPATENGQGIFECPVGYELMPLLCPFLSKTSDVNTDKSVPSFHGPTTTPAWTDAVSVETQAVGHLTQNNPSTTWDIDLHVPCFKGECAQDWVNYVHTANPDAVAANYMLDPGLKGEALGCDLWYELTSVNRAATEPEVIYNSVPNPLAANYPSQPFQAQQTSEFGDYIHLGGTARTLTTVTLTMSDWALFADYTGDVRYNGNSATWAHPITINIYSNHLGSNGVPDTLLATKTQAIDVPWRPAEDPTQCPTKDSSGYPYKWQSIPGPADTNCSNGYAFNATFDLSSLNVVLPDDIIVGIVYNTQTYGPSPIGSNGPYNSLNVAVPTNDPVTVGSDDSVSEVFWNTSTAGWYADGGAAGVGIFRKDINWTPNGTVALKIEAQ